MFHDDERILLKIIGSVSVIVIAIIIWILVAKVDVIAQTSGQIIPSSRLKNIQVSQTSIIQNIYVKEGAEVKKGALLARLDSTNEEAEALSNKKEAELYKLSLKRIDAQLYGKTFSLEKDDNPVEYEHIKAELHSRLTNHQAEMDEAQSAILEAKSELTNSQMQYDKLAISTQLWHEKKDAYEELKTQGAIAHVEADDKIRDANEKLGEIKQARETIALNSAKLKEAQDKLAKIQTDYNKSLLTEKTDILDKQAKAIAARDKAEHEVSISTLIAPVDGIVKDLNVHTKDGVLTPGNSLMTIVPKDDVIQAEVIVRNEDIGYIQLGQAVKLKVASFPYQKYGLLHGKVINISPDAMDNTDNKNGNSSNNEDKQKQEQGYKVLVQVPKNYIQVGAKKYDLIDGMKVQADIKISDRTIFEYLTDPLRKLANESATER
jgi:hemolysin D